MRKIIFILFLSLLILSNTGYSQEISANKISIQDPEIINKDIINSFVILQDKNRNHSTGFLIGLKNDTLIIYEKDKNRDVSINDLASLTIESRHKGGAKDVTIGGLMGTYLFFVAFTRAKNYSKTGYEPFAYWWNSDPLAQALVSLFFTFLGSVVGNIIDDATSEDIAIFDFSGNEIDKTKEFQRLKIFLTGDESPAKFHLNFQLSQVGTRLSELKYNFEDYSIRDRDVTSFNLVRKIQFTYSILDKLEIGGAVSWFGEPAVIWYPDSPEISEIALGEHAFEGFGLYAVAVYNPFHSIFPETFSWKLGAGIGSGDVDYKFDAVINDPNSYNRELDTTLITIKKTLFSALLFTQLDLFLYDSFSLGLVADYIYLPDETPGIPELKIGPRKLGNFSFGFTLGLHF